MDEIEKQEWKLHFSKKTLIYGTGNPWGSDFEPTLVWGSVEGRMFYAGVRLEI